MNNLDSTLDSTGLKKQIDELLTRDDVQLDKNFVTYLQKLYEQIIDIESNYTYVDASLKNSLRKHNNWYNALQQTTTKAVPIKEVDAPTPIQESKEEKTEDDINNNHNPATIQWQETTNLVNEKSKKSDKLEFKFGTTVLSMLACILILIGMTIFGTYVYTNFMSDIARGLSLVGLSILVTLAGELIFRPRLPKFGLIITSLGCGGLYVSLIANYYFLDTINSVTALTFTVLIALIIIILSNRNHSNVIRAIGLLGAYICIFPREGLPTLSSLIVTMIIITSLHIINLVFPIRKDNKLDIIFTFYSFFMSIVFSLTFIITIAISYDTAKEPYNVIWSNITINQSGYETAMIIFVLVNTIIYNLLYLIQLKQKKYFWIPILGFIVPLLSITSLYTTNQWLLLGFFIISSIFTLIRCKKEDGWIMLYQVMFSLFPLIFISDDDFFLFMFLLLTFISTLVLFFNKNLQTIIAFLLIIFTFISIYFFYANFRWEIIYLICMIIVTLVLSFSDKEHYFIVTLKYITIFSYLSSIPAILIQLHENLLYNYCSFGNSIFLTTLFYFISPDHATEYIWLIEVANILFFLVGLYLIPILKAKDNLTVTPFFVVLLAIIYLFLTYFETPVFILLSILGLISLVILSQPRFSNITFFIKHKYLVYSLFVSYVCVSYEFKYKIDETLPQLIFSILFMLIALGCVSLGFYVKQKNVRIYGLILALIVCGKLVFMDFIVLPFLERSLVFVVVGIIALGISLIYAILEKKIGKTISDLPSNIQETEI